MDHTRTPYLVPLRGADVGCLLFIDIGPRRGAGSRDVCFATDRYGSTHVALCIWLVSHGAVLVSIDYVTRVECESRTQNPTGVGTAVWIVLAVLDSADVCYRAIVMVG